MLPPKPASSVTIAVAGPTARPEHLSWRLALILAAFSGVLLALSFPAASQSWLAWIALAPLMLICRRADSGGQAFWAGYLAGAVFFGASCPWIYYAVHHYGGLPAGVAGLVLGLFMALMGVFLALFAVGGFWLRRAPLTWLTPALLWTALELLRTYTPLGGFPWNLLGYSQVEHAGFMLSVTVAGVYGAGFLVALENALVAWAISEFLWPDGKKQESEKRIATRRGAPLRVWGAALAVWIAIVGFASFPYDPPGMPVGNLQAVLVQPKTPLESDWTTTSFAAYLARLSRLSLSSPTGVAPNLILWPEDPAPLDYPAEPELRTALAALAARSQATLLVAETPQAASGVPLNSALLIRPDGSPGARYDKRHLVPFGEYVPLPVWLSRWAGIHSLTGEVGDFIPGHRAVLFHLAAAGHEYGFAALICYESIFPELARHAVSGGAEWLVNLSDDGWYGNSSARPQGLAMARVRAMENRRWLLRATNNGITAVINPYGRVLARLPTDTASALTARFGARQDLTFYTRHGDWFAYAATIVLAALALLAFFQRGAHPRPAKVAAR